MVAPQHKTTANKTFGYSLYLINVLLKDAYKK